MHGLYFTIYSLIQYRYLDGSPLHYRSWSRHFDIQVPYIVHRPRTQ